MSTKSHLAIIIPAYKGCYLANTLSSFLDQTCQNFTIYIGDDNSPDNLIEIIDRFSSKLNITYKKFKKNLGGVDLVGQWNRCIDLIEDEQWIWLFSDDDYVENVCVETFYKNLHQNVPIDIYRFNNQIVDKDGIKIGGINKFPKQMSSVDFFNGRINKTIYSYAVEYIINRKAFEDVGGFQYFDLCWSTDDATWIKLAKKYGIYTMQEGTVYWRYSGLNISSITNDKPIVIRKLDSNVAFLLWAEDYFKKNGITDRTTVLQKLTWLLTMPIETTSLRIAEKKEYILKSLKILKLQKFKLLSFSILFFGLFKKFIKTQFPFLNR